MERLTMRAKKKERERERKRREERKEREEKEREKEMEREEDLRLALDAAKERGRMGAEREVRRRSRSRSRARSEDRSLEAMKIQMERLSKKMKYMESGRKWNSAANEKQFIYNCELRQIVIEDFRLVLEEYFGKKRMEVLRSIEEVVKKGE